MQVVRLSAAALFLVGASFAQLTQQQKVADFMQLSGLYAKYYAPYEWKRDVIGFDLYNIQPWLDQVNKTTDDLGFYDVMARYVASLKDSHDEFILPTDFEAYLHFDVDIYDGKVLVSGIDRKYLPSKKYPFTVGDQVISIDGVPAQDFITANIPYAANGSANPVSAARLAADAITFRYQGFIPRLSEIGDSATVVIQSQSGTSATYTITWDKLGTPLTKIGPVPTPYAVAQQRIEAAKARIENLRARSFYGAHRGGEDAARNPWGVWTGAKAQIQPDPVPAYMAPLMRLRSMNAYLPVAFGGFDNPTPVFNPPTGFKLHLGAGANDQFITGTYPAGSSTIGLIRIATMAPPSETLALKQFASEIAYMQANTDGLVIDVMSNGGGDPCYAEALNQYLIPAGLRGFSAQIRGTQYWVELFSEYKTIAQLQGAPDWVSNLYAYYLKLVQEAVADNRGMTGSVPVCDASFDVPAATDAKGLNAAYTKPIVLLTDTFTLSAAETFAMMLQDEARATVFGMRTDGGGGTVVEFNATDYSEGSTRVTMSLVTRKRYVQTPGFPASNFLENTGVYPDVVQDYMTSDNLLHGGRTFVGQFTSAVQSLIAAQP